MARPVGVTSKLKDNSRKNYKENEDWNKGKKIGRPKQRWVVPVIDAERQVPLLGKGYWEKV